jgi:HAE1 family hydrophobic/amphiphilic exporter-1
MGTAVFWGMLVATAFGVFLVPGLFVMMENLGFRRKKETGIREQGTPAPAAAAGSGGGH